MKKRHRNIINASFPRHVYEIFPLHDVESVTLPVVTRDIEDFGDGEMSFHLNQIGIVVYRRKKGWDSLWEIDYGRSEIFIE